MQSYFPDADRLLKVVASQFSRIPRKPAPTYTFTTEDIAWVMGSFCALNCKPFDPELLIRQFPPPYSADSLIHAARALAITADDMLTRFTHDLQKLAQDGGLTLNDGNGLPTTYSNWNNVSKALTAFAMQMYYADTVNAKDKTKELFTALTSGIQFDIFDVSKTFQTAFNATGKINLNDAKGYKLYFTQYLNYQQQGSAFTADEINLITEFLPTLRDWYVQAGATALNATDNKNRNAFMLGGTGNDSFTGAYGIDLVSDSDGSGSGKLIVNGAELTGTGAALKIADVYKNDTGYTYVKVNGGATLIAFKENDPNRIIVNGYTAGMLGLDLQGSLPTAPVATMVGDFKKKIDDHGTASTADDTYLLDDNGNYINDGAEAGALDLISGTTGNDVIDGKGGDDALSGRAGECIALCEASNDIQYAIQQARRAA